MATYHYTSAVAEFLTSLGWQSRDFTDHPAANGIYLYRYGSQGNREPININSLRDISSNWFDGSCGGHRFVLNCDIKGVMKPKVIDSRRPQWQRKVHAWLAEATFKLMDRYSQEEARRHVDAMRTQRRNEYLMSFTARHGITTEEFTKLWHVDIEWEGETSCNWTALHVIAHSNRFAMPRNLRGDEQLDLACRTVRTLLDLKVLH